MFADSELQHLCRGVSDRREILPRVQRPSRREAPAAMVPFALGKDAASDCSTDLGSDISVDELQHRDFTDGAVGMVTSFLADAALIIFDWDDTLLPTSWLGQLGPLCDDGPEIDEQQRVQLERLARCVARTLVAAKERGKVVIVTNAEEGWVESSCARFMPSLLPLIRSIVVVSARSTFQRRGVLAPTAWKYRAFAREFEAWRQEGVRATVFPGAAATIQRRQHVISIGDSLHEQQALAWATWGAPGCWAKSVKFMRRPDVELLAEQHQLVSDCFGQLVDLDDNLDVEVSLDGLPERSAPG